MPIRRHALRAAAVGISAAAGGGGPSTEVEMRWGNESYSPRHLRLDHGHQLELRTSSAPPIPEDSQLFLALTACEMLYPQ